MARIAGIDIPREKRLEISLTYIYGIGLPTAQKLCADLGLDPRGAKLIKSVFKRMSEHGVAILMSTHTLEVAEEMCDRISIILKGRIIAHGTVAELRAMAGDPADQLTAVFLKLTGGGGLQEIDEIV